MNKIVLDKENIINLKIEEDSICNISKDYIIKELNIDIKDNVIFELNHYSEINNTLKINITQNNNSKFIYNHSFISYDNYNLNIDITMKGNNSKNNINIHGISDNARVSVIIDGIVKENTFDNDLNECVKLLNINNGVSNIYPNMFINTKNVVANHSASVSKINEDYLFYLMSKGLERDECVKLILDGFLKNNAR